MQCIRQLGRVDGVILISAGMGRLGLRRLATEVDPPLLVSNMQLRAPASEDGEWTSMFEAGTLDGDLWVSHFAENFGWNHIRTDEQGRAQVTLTQLDGPLTNPRLIDIVFDRELPNPEVAELASYYVKPQVRYVGSQRCQSCHLEEFEQWHETGHAHAIESLKKEQNYRNLYCVQCHVTGFRQHGGYVPYQNERPMENVGCEICHGPGGEHVEEPRAFPLLLSPPRQLCQVCHNEEHSLMSTASFEGYRKRVEH